MTPEQISAACESFAKARSMAPDFGSKFYQQLASDYPETQAIFGSVSMEVQHNRFVSMLSIVLNRMKDGHPVTPILQDLGKFHSRFGIKDEDFKNFSAALMKVLRELLGSEFNHCKCDAWVAVFEEITRTMNSASDGPR